MKLKREIVPKINEIKNIAFIQHSKFLLSNEIPIYSFKSGTQEITRIEFVFKAGNYFQKAPLYANTTNRLLNEGTNKYNSKQIADIIDFYGAYLELEVDNDNAYITLYSLNKYLDTTLEIMESIIKFSIFPDNELSTYLNNKKQAYLISLQKVSHIARRKFAGLIYGETHPYGMQVSENTFDEIKTKNLTDFYKKYYSFNNCYITISGLFPENIYDTINGIFGKDKWGKGNSTDFNKQFNIAEKSTNFIKVDNVMQSSIRVGCHTINRLHKDYIKLVVINTVLGGYFGSRLMSNIREDKGYTYGIGSGVASFQAGGMFYISTDVGAKFTNKAMTEIYKELDLICDKEVSKGELETVKKYIIGNLIRNADGAFAMANIYKTIIDYNLPEDYFNYFISEVNNCSAKELLKIAQKYLSKDKMTELIVGQK